MAIKADRGGASSNNWYESGLPVRLSVQGGVVELWLALGSKGGGVTDVRVEIEKASYEELISAMLQCDFDNTVRSFATSCQKWRRSNSRG